MLLGEALRLPSELAGDRGSSGMLTSSRGWWLGAMGYASKHIGCGNGMWLGSGIDCWLGQSGRVTIGDSLGYGSDMGLLELLGTSLETFSSFWSIRCSMDKYWQVCWPQGIGGMGHLGLMAGTGRWASWYGCGSGMTGNGISSGMGMTGGRTGALGGGKDNFGSAEGNTIVRDGSGMVRGVIKGSKAAEDDEGSENFRGRS